MAAAADVALHILECRYGRPGGSAPSTEGLLSYQAEAVRRASTILIRRGGVLIADSVGLGKTHIAAALLRPFLEGDGQAALVVPSALRRHWLDSVAWPRRPEVITYARLSRGTHARKRFDVLVFDEAHALRNPVTRRYRAASALCRDARVVLLSATPVNNSVWDLYHLLRLFCGERDLVDAGVASLRGAFEEAAAASLLGTAPAIQPVLRALMIRRTRPFVRTIVGAGGEQSGPVFPEQRAPVAVRYALAASGSGDALEQIGAELLRLTFPAHERPADAGARRHPPRALLRLGFFKRLESSGHAFSSTLRAYDAMLERCVDGLARGLLIRARDDLEGPVDDAQLRLDALLFEPVPKRFRADEYRGHLDAERATVRAILGALAPVLERDEKLETLRALLRGELQGHKVLLFTQYRDTARYLHSRLSRDARVGSIDGTDARLGADRVDRRTVIRCFAPLANGVAPPPAHRTIDVLIATDVLAEGFNLQDANIVVSYDLPWNPVRLIQRIGRIDRLGSRHSTIGSFHFLPGDLERYLGLLDRIARKSSAIDASVGAEMPALHAELARALDRGDARTVQRIEETDAEWFELDERLQRAIASRPHTRRSFDDGVFPCAVVGHVASGSSRLSERPSGIVAAQVGARFEWVAVVDGCPVEDERTCARLLEAALTEPPTRGAGHGDTRQGAAEPAMERCVHALLEAARPVIARRASIAATGALLPAGGATARLGRRVLELAAALPGGPDARTCRRIERCLEGLAGLAPDELGAVEVSLLHARAPASLGLLLQAIEESIAARPSPHPGVRSGTETLPIRLIGALLER